MGDVVYSAFTIPASLQASWMPRKTQISVVEAAAPAIAVTTLGGRLRRAHYLLLVDSESAEGSLVKGYSSKEDLCELAGAFWGMNIALGAAPYIDRVPTDSNPADEPSKGQFAELKRLGATYLKPVAPDFLRDKLAKWEHLVGPWAKSLKPAHEGAGTRGPQAVQSPPQSSQDEWVCHGA